MRQIRFRGKRVDNGEWVVGDLLHIAKGCVIYFGDTEEAEWFDDIDMNNPIAIELFKTETAVVYPETVGQFTGVKDKNGVEIYDGDVLRSNNPIIKDKYVVTWDYDLARFIVQKVGSSQWYNLHNDSLQIVMGNIHDLNIMKGGKQ